jgi:RsiW-degrading membrane proteinase PrsW (M82 family)
MSLFVQTVYLAAGLSLAYIFLLYRSNPLRRLPGTTVTVVFTVGMLAVLPVAFLHRFLPLNTQPGVFSSFVTAGLVEEGVKFAVMALTIWRLRFPDVAEPLDVAIYFGVLGVGFGVYEDFSYLFGGVYPAWSAGNTAAARHALDALALARAFPGHILFDGLAGFFVGAARFLPSWRPRIPWLVGAFLLAVALHGCFDLIATFGGTIPLLTYIVVLVGWFLILRRHALTHSPFRAVIRRVRMGDGDWPYPHPPIDYLFADGCAWPARPKSGMFQVFPLAMSLFILYPFLVAAVYVIERGILWGVGG